MDLSKSFEFFNPTEVKEPIHVIGCGSVGSYVATFLARSGLRKLHLWDFDTVESHNIANQNFAYRQIGQPKTSALSEIVKDINPEAIITTHGAWDGQMLNGYVFVCVDSVPVRKEIVTHLAPSAKALFDFRTGLTFAQHYAAENTYTALKQYLNTLQFDDKDAEASTPLSACGTTLGVVTTVVTIAAIGVNNFINYVKGEKLKWFIQINSFVPTIEAY